jgi:paraquat-inducible protein A
MARGPQAVGVTTLQSERVQANGGGVSLGRRITELVLFAALLLFAAGLCFPAFTVRSLLVYEKSYSVITGIAALYEAHDVLLALTLLLFSVVLPVVKLVVAFALLAAPRADGPFARALLKLLQAISKWAMADVFVVALTILVLNGELLTAGDLEPGAVFYAASVLLTSLALMTLPWVLRGRAPVEAAP